jgi:hypothetical protein
MRLLLLVPAATIAAFAATTYTKDVAPILYKNCVECHRAGEAAPMALTTYKETRPWAKAIREAVTAKRMPVWLATDEHAKFRNERSLTPAEIDTIAKWVAEGAPEGNAKNAPPLPEFTPGWNIGTPDKIFDIGTDFAVPASGTVPYKYFLVPSGFTEDTWITAAEIRADKRNVVHHVIVFILDENKKPISTSGGDMLIGWAPGEEPMRLAEGTARMVPKGAWFRVQMHYTTDGKETTDRSRWGVKFAKTPPRLSSIVGRALNGTFKIPPMEPNHEVKSEWTFRKDVTLESLMPHMHVRGKDFKYTLRFPDGREQTLLNVPRYDFNWQLSYVLADPIVIPAGTKMLCEAHFDNSPNNKANPDPSKEVRWGDQTWEEMMIGWFTYTVPGPGAEAALTAKKEGE